MTAPAPEVIAVGEPLIALLAVGSAPLADVESFSRHVAGAEANVAVGLARLGHRALFVGRVGADGFGRAILCRMRGEDVDVSGIVVDPERRTGLLVRERRALGASEVLYHRSGSAGSALGPSDIDAAGSITARSPSMPGIHSVAWSPSNNSTGRMRRRASAARGLVGTSAPS